MKILVICYMGMNRSKYLANFLIEQGFDAEYAGILPESKNLVTQEQIDRADLLVFVLPRIKEKFLWQFKVDKQKIITLDVEDRLDILCPTKTDHTPEEMLHIYRTVVYPELEKQILEHLQALS